MTMLNAHTATRSFRELQYDIKVFLDGIEQISPLESPQGISIVELKWADGSIDLVPSTEFILGLVSRLFPKLTLGGKAELLPDGKDIPLQNGKYHKYYLDLKVSNAGVQADIKEFGDGTESITINGGAIKTLKADTLTLGSGVRIGKMQPSGTVHTDYCIMNGGITVRDTLYLSDSSIFKNLHLNKIHLDCPIKIVTDNTPKADLSTYTNIGLWADEMVFGLYTVKHTMSYADYFNEDVQAELDKHKAHIFVQIPIPSVANNGVVTYSYKQTMATSFPDRMDKPFTTSSPASLLTLYPMKSFSRVSAYGTMYLKVEIPEMNNYLTTVCNPTDSSVRVCNAWMFTEETGEDRGTIVPLSYVVLPPYSCTDFLFKNEIKGGYYCAYMMPTVELASK